MNRAGSVRQDDFQPSITWVRLARLARFAEMNFQPGFFSGNLVVTFLHLCSWMGYFTSTSSLEGGTLVFSLDIVLG